MATFEAQVQGITSLTLSGSTTPTQDELSQFLKDGVMDVTNRWIATHPQDENLFTRESGEQTANETLHLNGARIISVVREDGTDNQWRLCGQISPGMQYEVTDTESLNYASKTNPVYMIGNNGQIDVFPAPSSNPAQNSFKVYYVNNDPEDKGGSNLIYSHSDIGYFADDKVYLVVLYASIKTLTAAMTGIANDLTSFSMTAVPPDLPIQGTALPTYNEAEQGVTIDDEITQVLTYIETDEDVELASAKANEVALRFKRALDQFNSDIVKWKTENEGESSRYNVEINAYQAEVNAQVTEQTTLIQTQTAKYQLYQGRIDRLQQEYFSAFGSAPTEQE